MMPSIKQLSLSCAEAHYLDPHIGSWIAGAKHRRENFFTPLYLLDVSPIPPAPKCRKIAEEK
jgi:hypothetical protein